MQKNVLHLINRLKYHAAIFLVMCNGIAAIKTARLTGCIHSKGYCPFLPRNVTLNATRCMCGCFCLYSPGGTVLPPSILIGSPTF